MRTLLAVPVAPGGRAAAAAAFALTTALPRRVAVTRNQRRAASTLRRAACGRPRRRAPKRRPGAHTMAARAGCRWPVAAAQARETCRWRARGGGGGGGGHSVKARGRWQAGDGRPQPALRYEPSRRAAEWRSTRCACAVATNGRVRFESQRGRRAPRAARPVARGGGGPQAAARGTGPPVRLCTRRRGAPDDGGVTIASPGGPAAALRPREGPVVCFHPREDHTLPSARCVCMGGRLLCGSFNFGARASSPGGLAGTAHLCRISCTRDALWAPLHETGREGARARA